LFFKRSDKLFVERKSKSAFVLVCHVCMKRRADYFYKGEKLSPTSPAVCERCRKNLIHVLKNLRSIREYKESLDAKAKK